MDILLHKTPDRRGPDTRGRGIILSFGLLLLSGLLLMVVPSTQADNRGNAAQTSAISAGSQSASDLHFPETDLINETVPLRTQAPRSAQKQLPSVRQTKDGVVRSSLESHCRFARGRYCSQSNREGNPTQRTRARKAIALFVLGLRTSG